MSERKLTKQAVMAIAMIFVSIFVISVTTYAWFMITNTPRITEAEFVADTIGNLQISNVNTAEDGSETPKQYQSAIGLIDGVTDEEKKKLYLSPVTTPEGEKFYRPIYKEGKISEVKLLDENIEGDKNLLHSKYIYEKKFFLRAGAAEVDVNKAKTYNIHLVGQKEAEKTPDGTFDSTYGCFLKDKTGTETEGAAAPTAANAIRVSFVFENTVSGTEVIYEPNCDGNNEGTPGEGGNMLEYQNGSGETFGAYTTIKQKGNKSFKVDGSTGTDEQSETICTIKEGEDIKVIMRIWIEGMDKDCSNDVAADKIEGQLQFISEEVLAVSEENT